jgi:hypothetical protein
MRKEKRKQGNVKRIKREQKRKRQVRIKLYVKKGRMKANRMRHEKIVDTGVGGGGDHILGRVQMVLF